jgi:hypothetical protein
MAIARTMGTMKKNVLAYTFSKYLTGSLDTFVKKWGGGDFHVSLHARWCSQSSDLVASHHD